MSGVAAIGAAVAIGVAADSIATVGLTIGSAFAITAAVGATLGAVGTITHIKELQMAGAALGAVGAVGGIASAAGLFGAASDVAGAGGSFGASGAGELGLAAGGTSGATDAGTWAGTTISDLHSAGASALQDVGTGSSASSGMNVVDVVNNGAVPTGQAPVPTGTPQNVVPDVAGDVRPDSQGVPAFQDVVPKTDLSASDVKLPDFQGIPKFGPPPEVQSVPDGSLINGQSPDPARSLLNGGAPPANMSPADVNGQFSPMPTNQNMTPLSSNAPDGSGFGTAADPPPTPVQNDPTNPAAAAGGTTPPASQITGNTDLHLAGASALQDVADKSPWGGVMDFITKNPPLMYGAIQTLGSFVNGVASPLPQAQVDELESRKQQNLAAASLANQQQQLLQRRFQNMSQGVPTASRSLINGGSAVTGRPA